MLWERNNQNRYLNEYNVYIIIHTGQSTTYSLQSEIMRSPLSLFSFSKYMGNNDLVFRFKKSAKRTKQYSKLQIVKCKQDSKVFAQSQRELEVLFSRNPFS